MEYILLDTSVVSLLHPAKQSSTRRKLYIQDICRKNGRRLESGDCWIATTAVYLDIPLLTHDKDFKELPLENLKVICHAE